MRGSERECGGGRREGVDGLGREDVVRFRRPYAAVSSSLAAFGACSPGWDVPQADNDILLLPVLLLFLCLRLFPFCPGSLIIRALDDRAPATVFGLKVLQHWVRTARRSWRTESCSSPRHVVQLVFRHEIVVQVRLIRDGRGNGGGNARSPRASRTNRCTRASSRREAQRAASCRRHAPGIIEASPRPSRSCWR